MLKEMPFGFDEGKLNALALYLDDTIATQPCCKTKVGATKVGGVLFNW